MKDKREPPTPVRFPANDNTLEETLEHVKRLGTTLNKYIVEAVKKRNKSGK